MCEKVVKDQISARRGDVNTELAPSVLKADLELKLPGLEWSMVLQMIMRIFPTVLRWCGLILAFTLLGPAPAKEVSPESGDAPLPVQVRVFDSLMPAHGIELSSRQRFYRLERVWREMVEDELEGKVVFSYHRFPAKVDETKPVLNLYLLEWMSDRMAMVSFRIQVRLDYLESSRDFGIFSKRKTLPLVGNSIVDERRMSVVAEEACMEVANAIHPYLEALSSTGMFPEVEGSDAT